VWIYFLFWFAWCYSVWICFLFFLARFFFIGASPLSAKVKTIPKLFSSPHCVFVKDLYGEPERGE
jgi:hypothetical protein